MQPLEAARDHLAKAREFLTAADVELSGGLYSVATSNAVLAGINAKDAICLRLTGRNAKTENHRDAISELATSGPAGKALEATFRRLLELKTASQYHPGPISTGTAAKALEWATAMVNTATDVVQG